MNGIHYAGDTIPLDNDNYDPDACVIGLIGWN